MQQDNKNTIFEDSFSEEVWASTYKDHNDNDINDTFRRVSNALASQETNAEEWANNFYDLLTGFKATPGGRILSNAGTEWGGTTLCNCFNDQALIYTSDGYKNITDVEIGDEVLTHTGKYQRVINILERNYDGPAFEYESSFLTNSFIVTPEHPFYQNDNTWKTGADVNHLVLGSDLLPEETNRTIEFKRKEINFKGKVYNLSVENDESYVVNNIITHNCFVGTKPEYDQDSLDGIIETLRAQAKTLKSEGGWGMNFSFIRPRGSFIKGIGVETPGAIAFMEMFDKSSEIITSGSGLSKKNKTAKGKIRKGAQMAVLDCWHPDVEEFISAKLTPGRLTKFNLSVNMSDQFMEKIIKLQDLQENDAPEEEIHRHDQWHLVFPDTEHPEYKQKWDGDIDYWISLGYPVLTYKTVSALDLWEQIMKSTYSRNDPGVLFADRANKTHLWNYGGRKALIKATNPCVPSDTWVMTIDGPKQVKDLLENNFIAIIDGQPQASTAFWYTGKKKVFEVLTEYGFKVKATSNHVFKTTKGDKKLEELEAGDKLIISNHNNFNWPGNGNFQQGWLTGSLIGDGHFTKKSCKLEYWGESKESMLHLATTYLKNNFSEKSNLGTGKITGKTAQERDIMGLNSISLRKYVENIKIYSDKNLSQSDIEKMSSDFYRGVLCGWFDADGSIQGNSKNGVSIRLSSSYLENLEVAQRMLIRLGIFSRIFLRRPENEKMMPDGKGGMKLYRCKSQYDLLISKDSIRKYSELISFKEPLKIKTLNYLLSNEKVGKLPSKFESKVKSVTYIGETDVYDCTVENVHIFCANGIHLSNCGEQFLPFGGVCDLGSLNLTQFVNEELTDFDYEKISKYVPYLVRFLDNVNDITDAPLQEYIDSIRKRRRIGLGILGWASALIMMRVRFASDKAEELKEKLMRCITSTAVNTSVDLAIEKGMFEGCDPEQCANHYFWNQIELSDEIRDRIRQHGMRNSALFSIQPTGNTSVLANVVSGGLEPIFLPEYIRTVIVPVVPDHIKDATPKYWHGEFFETEMFNFAKEGLDQILRGKDEFGTVYKIDRNRGLTKEVLCTDYGVRKLKDLGLWNPEADWAVTTENLSADEHVKDMKGWGKWLDSSFSKTINLPNDYSYDDFKQIYLNVYKTGYLKGATTYRAGTMTTVLSSAKSGEESEQSTISRVSAPPERPKILPAKVFHPTSKDQRYYVIVGLFNNEVFEVFVGDNNHKTIPYGLEEAAILKKTKGVYSLLHGKKQYPLNVDLDPNLDALTRMISACLKSGCDIAYLVEQLERTKGNINVFAKVIARILKKFIPDGSKLNENCPECNSPLMRAEGCKRCTSCEYSICG